MVPAPCFIYYWPSWYSVYNYYIAKGRSEFGRAGTFRNHDRNKCFRVRDTEGPEASTVWLDTLRRYRSGAIYITYMTGCILQGSTSGVTYTWPVYIVRMFDARVGGLA